MISSINTQNTNTAFKAKLSVLNNQCIKARSINSDEDYKQSANNYMQNGNFDKAIELYQKALQQNPDDNQANLNIAKTYTFNNQHKEAIPYLQKYLDKAPKDIENITLLGECYKNAKEYSNAVDTFNRALSIEPEYDYAKRNLLDTKNLILAHTNPNQAKKERYETAVNNLTEAVKIAKNNLPKGYLDNMKDVNVSFDKTSKMGGRSNIAQYEHSKRKISVTDEYTYANPKLSAAYLIHEFTHGHDNDPYTSVYEEQDAYRVQAQYWVNKVKDIYDPEMDYISGLYKKSSESLDSRVAEIYKQRDPSIQATSPNHPPSTNSTAACSLSTEGGQPLKAYDVIV